MVYPGWRNARQRCRTAYGAVRRLAPIPPCGEDGGRLYSCGGIRTGGKRGARGRRGPRTLSPPLFYSQDKPCSGCVVLALWSPTHGCGWAGETKVRSARHQGSWRQKWGEEGSKYATRGLSLSPIWPRSMHTYFFLYTTASRCGGLCACRHTAGIPISIPCDLTALIA